MSNINKQGTGGAHITPSARPGIHDYWLYPFATSNMVRYGLNKDNRDSGHSDNEQGADVVDNVMSKQHYPIRSPSRQSRNIPRRNSLCTDKTQYTEDNNSDVLSKSVPATMPSQLYCSDDSEDEEAPMNKHQHSNLSYHSVGTPNRSNINKSRSYIAATPLQVLETTRNFAQTEQTPIRNSSSKMIAFVLCILVAVCATMFNKSSISNNNMSNYDEVKFYTDLSSLIEKYNVNENSILQVQTGISMIFKNQDTGSFMFVYNSNANNFNANKFNKFVNDVSNSASKYLRNNSTPVHYTMVEGSSLNMEEHSELISKYRQELDRTGVMLVRHIEAVPSTLAMAFHYYCDEYNPLVKKSAILFTLNLANCPEESDKSFHALIEKCLSKKWSTIPIDNIGPLLTRVVSVVIDVTSAF